MSKKVGFQIYVILNGIKTQNYRTAPEEGFQIYVILNGIKTTLKLIYRYEQFQIYVILNGIKTLAFKLSSKLGVLDLCHFKWY